MIKMPFETSAKPPPVTNGFLQASANKSAPTSDPAQETSPMLSLTSPVVAADDCRDAGKHQALLCRDAVTLEAGSGSDEMTSCCSGWFLLRHDKSNSGNRQRSRRQKTAFHQVRAALGILTFSLFSSTSPIRSLTSAYMCFASHSHRWCG